MNSKKALLFISAGVGEGSRDSQESQTFSYRKLEHSASMEKAITVYGQPENCTAACKRILEVMEEEAKNVGKPTEISLKILAHNNLIGRIIGKQGATIKKIMEVHIKYFMNRHYPNKFPGHRH